MTDSSKIDRLYFGKDDAETDISRGGLLREGFLRTRAYEEALSGKKTLIIGRKGSGKSAICLMLSNDLSAKGKVSLVTPDEISADEIRRFQLPGIPLEQSKKLIWRYIFAVQVAKFLLATARQHAGGEENTSGDLVKLRHFLSDNGEVDDLTFTERFWRIIERLKGSVSLEAFGVKVAAEGQERSPGVKANDQLDVVEAEILKAAAGIQRSIPGMGFHLLVDQIEKVWSNDKESDAMVVGLLLAANHIRSKFAFVLCTIFIRTDIYEQLQFQDRDKFRGEEFRIDWDPVQLRNLIVARAQASMGFEISDDVLWSQVFPRHVGGKPCWIYLVSRTLMRPRDIIQFCNACRDTARTNGHDVIQEGDIQQALSLYSNWKLSDLQNEWMVNYPFLPDVFLIFANTSSLMNRAKFESAFQLIKNDLAVRYPALTRNLSGDAVLGILYAIGLIGVVRQGEAIYYYEEKTKHGVQPQDCEFILHPSFRNALQSTSAINLRPFEPDDPGASLIRDRFHAERRFGKEFATVRGARPERAVKSIVTVLHKLTGLIASSSLADELRDELRRDINAMALDLTRVVDSSDQDAIMRNGERVYRHLVQLRQRLGETGRLDRNSDIEYMSEDIIRQMERFLYRGELDEYFA